jgi:hypothetical protein
MGELQKQIGTKTKSVGGERIEMFLDTVKSPAVNYYDLGVGPVIRKIDLRHASFRQFF